MTPCACVIWYGHFSVLHSLEYTLLKIWQLIHYETYQSTVSFIPTFVHYLLRFYIQGLKHDGPSFCHSLSSCKPSFSHFQSFHYQELVVPHPPLHPQNNTFFPSPCETSLVFYQASFIQASCSALPVLPLGEPEILCCTLHVDKQSSWLLPPGTESVTSTRLGPGIPTTFLNLGFTVTDQFGESGKKKKIRKRLQQQMSWG